MPKIVDHDLRRAEIVAGFIDLVGQVGLANATSRALADHMGVSNGALWRYFIDKNDLLAAVTAAIVANTNERASLMLADKCGIEAAITMIEALLPLDHVSQDEAQIVVGHWGLSAMDSSTQRGGRFDVEQWGSSVEAFLTQAVQRGELVSTTPVSALSQLLMAHAVNEQIDYVFTGTIDRDRALAPVRQVLDTFRP